MRVTLPYNKTLDTHEMKKRYTLGFLLMAGTTMAQVPTNFGSNAGDGITYSTYNLIDHGVVSSVRFQAQNAISEGEGTWEFYTGDYMNNWRPYTADDTLSGFDAIIDPAIETASARYNSNYGGQTGKLPAIQAGYYYTCIIQDGTGDNKMSIIETDFEPVQISDITQVPTDPTTADDIVITVSLSNALTLSPGEHVFLRYSLDGFQTSDFLEVTNFSNGAGVFTIPGGSVPAGVTVAYYGIVTEEAVPVHETIDYFSLFFANNNGANYSFTVSAVTGIDEVQSEFGIAQTSTEVIVKNVDALSTIDLISMDGRLVSTNAVNGQTQVALSTQSLPVGIYTLVFRGNGTQKSAKIAVK